MPPNIIHARSGHHVPLWSLDLELALKGARFRHAKPDARSAGCFRPVRKRAPISLTFCSTITTKSKIFWTSWWKAETAASGSRCSRRSRERSPLTCREKVVYDAVIAVKGKKDAQDGEEGYLEHGLADRMLATLGKISGAMSPEFRAAAKVLKELALHHVREEENNTWPDVREHFSEDERIEMGRRFQLAKQRVRIVLNC